MLKAIKTASAARDDERGITLVELLVAMSILILVLGVIAQLFIVMLRAEPRITGRSADIQQARVWAERLTRELRQTSEVLVSDPAQIAVVTYVRTTQCGSAGTTPPATQDAIQCRVTYSCASGTCSRSETDTAQMATAKTEELVHGISNSTSVFTYTPTIGEPEYVGVRLEYPAGEGEDSVTLQDGVDLRNR
jgi:type II secretory pathway component PulJ